MLWQPTRGVLQPNQHWRRPQASAAAAFSFISGISTEISGSGGGSTGAIDTTGAGLLILVACMYEGHAASPTIADSKSNSWTALTEITADPTADTNINIYYSVPTSVGTSHTASLTGSVLYETLIFASFTPGAASPFDQENGNSFNGSSAAVNSITPSANNELVIAGVCTDGNGIGASSINGGFTIIDDAVNNSNANWMGGCAAYLIQTSAAAAAPTWTLNGNSGWAVKIASFKVS